MSRIPHLRVIIESEPCSGQWNMAADEALLETAVSQEIATLRFYEWNQPTVSLGYFQKSSDFDRDPVLSKLPVVRRLTGGGAILHDNELTYSIQLPSSQKLFVHPSELYDIVHQAIVDALRLLGISIVFRGQTLKLADEPLLCFQRQDSHDLTLAGTKVLGSAQRRRRGAILQHGSLIRRASPLAKQLRGIEDLCNFSLPADLPVVLADPVAKAIAETWKVGSFNESELQLTRQLCEQQSLSVRQR